MATLPLSLDVLLFCRLMALLRLVGSAAGGGSGGVGSQAGSGAGGGGVGPGGIGVRTGFAGMYSVLVVCFYKGTVLFAGFPRNCFF